MLGLPDGITALLFDLANRVEGFGLIHALKAAVPAAERLPEGDRRQLRPRIERAIRNLDRESNLLRNVRAALRRIDEGTFGVCVHCEEEISPKRIAAVRTWMSRASKLSRLGRSRPAK